jgi:hypothetical protein
MSTLQRISLCSKAALSLQCSALTECAERRPPGGQTQLPLMYWHPAVATDEYCGADGGM